MTQTILHLLAMSESVRKSRKKRLLEFLSVFMTLGMIAAIGTLLFLGWLTDQVFEGDMRRFDDVTRAAVHHAETRGAAWLDRLGAVVCLGTPHHGAPLERAVVERRVPVRGCSAILGR